MKKRNLVARRATGKASTHDMIYLQRGKESFPVNQKKFEEEKIMLIIVVLVLGLLALTLVAQGCLLSKSGEKGAKILIPFYGSYLLYKAADATGLFAVNVILSVISTIATMAGGAELVSILGIGSLLVSIFFNIKLAKAYGKSGGFAVGLIFLPIIFLCILAFGDAEHVEYAAAWKRKNGVKPEAIPTWKCPVCGATQPQSRLSCSECGEKRP